MSIRPVKAGTTAGVKTYFYFRCVDAADGITAEVGEAGGQPYISVDGGTPTTTGIATLTAVDTSNFPGLYRAQYSGAPGAGTLVQARYKSANTAEAPATYALLFTSYDPYSNEVVANITGNLSGSVGSVAGGVGGSVTGSVGSVLGNVGGNVVGSVGSVTGNVGGNLVGNLLGTLPADSIGASQIAANAIDDASVSSDLDSYAMLANVVRVDGSNQRYGVTFIKNGGAAITGASITGTPTITVTNQAGTVKVNAQNLTQIGTTGGFYYAASGASLLSSGDSAIVQVTATIDGSSRSVSAIVGYNNNA